MTREPRWQDMAADMEDRLEDALAEIERQTAAIVHGVAQAKKREAEIERLKAGIREYACTGTDHPCGCYDQFLSERAEIERLQEENDMLRSLILAFRPICEPALESKP
jgi:hypothetical protein